MAEVEAIDTSFLPLMEIGTEQAFTPEETIYILTRYLAGRCDGAHQQDSMGFNKLHAEFGAKLAQLPFEAWSDRQLWAARKMLATYKNTQISQWWELVPEIPEPVRRDAQRELDYAAWKRKQDPAWQPEETYRRLRMTIYNGQPAIALHQSYDGQLIQRIKNLPQRQYDGESKTWSVPLHAGSIEAVINFALENAYDIDEAVEQQISTVLTDITDLIELSHAKDGDYQIDLPPGLELYPFQRIGVQYAERVKNVLIADQMGLGKTVQGLLAVGVANAFPAVIVCPASIKTHWTREARKWLPGKKIGLLASQNKNGNRLIDANGKSLFDLLVVNYDVLKGWTDAIIEINPKAVIADECHKVKTHTSQRHKALRTILEGVPGVRKIFLSGTPVVNRPMEFWSLIDLLGYGAEMGGLREYKYRYDTDWRPNLEELNQRARSRFMIRRLKADVLPELPDKQRITMPVEIDNRKEYTQAEQDIAGYFAQKSVEDESYSEQKLKFTVEAIQEGLSGDEMNRFVRERMNVIYGAAFTQAYAIAARNEELLRWEALKQLAVKGKMAAVEAWIDEFLESDEKLVIFATHTHVVERLARRYNAPFIRGDVKPEHRMPLVDRFQTDPNCRVIVGNINAMGEGLTLTAASNVVFVEFGWNPKDHDQAEDRLHRIGQRDAVTVWNLCAEATIDEELADMIERKRLITDAIQDGGGRDVQREFMDQLKASLNNRLSGKGK